MTAPSGPTGPQPAPPPPGTYRLDPGRSSLRADVKAMFGLATVHATFQLQAGEIHIAEDPARSTVKASIDAASFASGNTKRDRDVTSAGLLNAAAYPDITFTG